MLHLTEALFPGMISCSKPSGFRNGAFRTGREAPCVVEFFKSIAQLIARDAQQLGSACLIAAAPLDRLLHKRQLCLIKRDSLTRKRKLDGTRVTLDSGAAVITSRPQ